MSRSAAVPLLLIFLAAHIVLLPRTLEDLDSINFALGVRQFDVARHQPHPPGYPVFIGLAKVSTSVLRSLGVDAPAVRGLAVWSALGGALALPALLLLFRSLEGREHLAWWTTCVTAASPLYWSTALRPLSDMTGFAVATVAQALFVFAIRGRLRPARERSLASRDAFGAMSAGPAIVLGGLLAGIAVGVRVQTGILTFPLMLLVLVLGRDTVSGRARIAAIGAATAGVLAWAIPLLVASGGPAAYLRALGAQAGADFSGVVMLWTHRTPRVAVHALVNSFVWPWTWWPGAIVCGLGAVGAIRTLFRSPRAALVLIVTFAPYAVFHLLFQETGTVRYALPLVPPVAYFATTALEIGRGRLLLPGAAVALAAVSLVIAVPATTMYAREGAPIFRLFDDMVTTAHGGERVDFIGMHAVARRASEWVGPVLPAPVGRAPHGREWLTLVDLWKKQPLARVWFAADPKRSDLALFDPRSREIVRSYQWGFVEPPIVGGARPDNADWYRMQPPAWMLDRGWAVTAEVGGVTASDGLGPHRAASIAWLRHPFQETTVVIGGRHLGATPDPVILRASLDGAVVDSQTIPPGFFVRRFQLAPAGTGSAAGYVPLAVDAQSASHVPVALEQFDAQGPGVPMLAYEDGWYEPEFSQEIGRAWRWSAPRSRLWVRPIGRDVTLRLTGESPRRYFDSAPHVRVLVADREVFSFDPSSDFDQQVRLPADLLDQAEGRVVLESSRFFIPGKNGAGDQRRLALRMFAVGVN